MNVLQALDSIKKAGSSIPKNSAKRLEKEVSGNFYEYWRFFSNKLTETLCFLQVEEITKRYVKSVEDICKAKEKEISRS